MCGDNGTTKTGIPKPPAPCTLTSCDPVTNTDQNSGRQTKIITSQPETRLAVPLGGGSGGTNTNGCGAIFNTGTGATTCIAPTYGGNANNSILTQTGSIALPNSTVGGLNGSPTLNSADWTKLIAAALAIAAAAAAGLEFDGIVANQGQAGGGDDVHPPSSADDVREILGQLPKGRSPGVRTVESDDALQGLFEELTAGGRPVNRPGYDGPVSELPDGTQVGIRDGSKSGGRTIDIRYPGAKGSGPKVHVG